MSRVVADGIQSAAQVMGADTGLHADQAGRKVGKPSIELVAREFLAQNDGAALVEADEVEGVFANVEAEGGDGIFGLARHGRAIMCRLDF